MAAASLDKKNNELEMRSELKSRMMSLFQHSGLISSFFFFITGSVFMKLEEKIHVNYGISVNFTLVGLMWVSLGNIFLL